MNEERTLIEAVMFHTAITFLAVGFIWPALAMVQGVIFFLQVEKVISWPWVLVFIPTLLFHQIRIHARQPPLRKCRLDNDEIVNRSTRTDSGLSKSMAWGH